MAHLLEIVDGKASMAYAGEVPWHGLGKHVSPDLTPQQMLEAAGLDWEVYKIPATVNLNSKKYNIGWSALVRKQSDKDDHIMGTVSNDWEPVQNSEAFAFFHEFVAAGDMEMHTAGSISDGQIVWGLAKIKESFELFEGDRIDAHLLFTNFHKYGFSTDVRFTPIRVVCNNTLSLSLSSKVDKMIKFSHRRKFNPEHAKEMLGIATSKLHKYKELASFLGSRKAKNEDIVDYFKRIFPLSTTENSDKLSRNADKALKVLDHQPGVRFAPGSWWQPFNAVTFMTDHVIGRSYEARLESSWYGQRKDLKNKALKLAVDFAQTS